MTASYQNQYVTSNEAVKERLILKPVHVTSNEALTGQTRPSTDIFAPNPAGTTQVRNLVDARTLQDLGVFPADLLSPGVFKRPSKDAIQAAHKVPYFRKAFFICHTMRGTIRVSPFFCMKRFQNDGAPFNPEPSEFSIMCLGGKKMLNT